MAGAKYTDDPTITSITGNEKIPVTQLGVDKNWTFNDLLGWIKATDPLEFAGSITMSPAKVLTIRTGSGQRAGNATLVGGTITVNNATVTANTIVMVTRKTIGGVPGNLTYTLSAGSSFTINSANGADTSTVSYFLIEVV